MLYTEDDIRRAVSMNAFIAGDRYQAQRKVLSFDTRDDGAFVSRVRGGDTWPYEQVIVVQKPAVGATTIRGECTCPVEQNCKHVAAALLEGLRRKLRPPVASAMPTPEAPRSPPWGSGSAPVASPAESLPADIAMWLDGLDRARATAEETFPKTITQRLIYVLLPARRANRAPELAVKLLTVRLMKDGRPTDAGRPFAPERAAGHAAKFLRPSDIRICRILSSLPQRYQNSDMPLPEGELLADIVATGRAHWLTVDGAQLTLGEPRPGRIAWAIADGETMRPVLEVGGGVVVLTAAPPIYVDAAAGLIGPLETGFPAKVAATLLDAPPVPAAHAALLGATLRQRAPDLAAAIPAPQGPTRTIEVPPVPHLRLFGMDLPGTVISYMRGYSGYTVPTELVGLARLSFRYGSTLVGASDARPRLIHFEGEGMTEIRRDMAAERAHAKTLTLAGLVPVGRTRRGVPPANVADLVPEGDALAWLDTVYHDLPDLTAKGWIIEVGDDFPFRLLRGDGGLDAEVRESSGIDWFELGVGILVDGERIDLIGPIVALIASPGFDAATLQSAVDDEPFYLPLEDGRVLALQAARIAPIVAAIQDLAMGASVGEGRLRLRAADVAGLAAFETATAQAGFVWHGGERLRDMGRKLGQAGVPTAIPPATFRATLRPYQAQGVSWLAFLRDVGFGGVLADDMGLGKTVQALALMAIEKAAGRLDRPALVVAPTSLVANWRMEAERFAPDLRVLTLHGLDRKTRFGAIAESDVVLTTYPLIARDHAVLGETPWHLLVLDEAQTIKNPDAATTKIIVELTARHRFCLSGTPLENHLGELWSLFSFVLPGFLGDRQHFTKTWRTPIEKQGDGARARALARRVKPFLLRRTKEEVASELPAKTEIVERIELPQSQRDIYEAIRLSMHERVREAIAKRGLGRSRIVILDALLKLRQACCDPRLLNPQPAAAEKAGSAKLERLIDVVTELLAENRRIILFSQFTSMLALVRTRLGALGIDYALLTGQTRDREAQIQAFQGGGVPLFLVSLKAGGTGLNLTAADTVILYDPWWNPAVEDQAIDRAHRIGQNKPVFVHKLVAVGTIEEKMEVLKARKRALASSLFDEDGMPTLAMTEADLQSLFAADPP